jgi:hypothetical protein
MESKVLKCECGMFIGVITSEGLMMGNLLSMSSFQALCSGCESLIIWNGKDKKCNILAPMKDSKFETND